jgi:thiaminase
MVVHPFGKAIEGGTLGRDLFESYLKQNYVYRIDCHRLFGLVSATSYNETWQRRKSQGLPKILFTRTGSIPIC